MSEFRVELTSSCKWSNICPKAKCPVKRSAVDERAAQGVHSFLAITDQMTWHVARPLLQFGFVQIFKGKTVIRSHVDMFHWTNIRRPSRTGKLSARVLPKLRLSVGNRARERDFEYEYDILRYKGFTIIGSVNVFSRFASLARHYSSGR